MAQSQQTLVYNKNTKKKATIEATKLKTLRVKELIIKGTEVKPKILAKEDV